MDTIKKLHRAKPYFPKEDRDPIYFFFLGSYIQLSKQLIPMLAQAKNLYLENLLRNKK